MSDLHDEIIPWRMHLANERISEQKKGALEKKEIPPNRSA